MSGRSRSEIAGLSSGLEVEHETARKPGGIGAPPHARKAEIVAGGGENGVGAVAVAALEVIAVRAMLGLDVADHRLDGGWAPHLAADAR